MMINIELNNETNSGTPLDSIESDQLNLRMLLT